MPCCAGLHVKKKVCTREEAVFIGSLTALMQQFFTHRSLNYSNTSFRSTPPQSFGIFFWNFKIHNDCLPLFSSHHSQQRKLKDNGSEDDRAFFFQPQRCQTMQPNYARSFLLAHTGTRANELRKRKENFCR